MLACLELMLVLIVECNLVNCQTQHSQIGLDLQPLVMGTLCPPRYWNYHRLAVYQVKVPLIVFITRHVREFGSLMQSSDQMTVHQETHETFQAAVWTFSKKYCDISKNEILFDGSVQKYMNIC